MKYGCLLIGFEYKNIDTWRTLPGIPVDLYKVYLWSKNICNNINVLTDINKDYNTTRLKKAIIDGYVDSNLLSFIEDTKTQKHHTLFVTHNTNNYISNNFETVIGDFIDGLDRIFVYFTGHCKNGHIILPDNTHISLDHIRDILSKNRQAQIIIILDCCESNGMSLPFIYNTRYKLNSLHFIKPEIICLNSSHVGQDANATLSGSPFTRDLFQYLNKNTNKIVKIKDLDNIVITASHPNLNVLWSWFNHKIKTNMNVIIYNNVVNIILHECCSTIEKSSSMKNYLRYKSNLNYRN